MPRTSGETVSIGGHRLRLTNPDKVMYPSTGTTKADVISYYVQIAPYLLPHVVGRPATRKRWVDGVGTADKPGEVFFEKNMPTSAPSWIHRASIQHRSHRNSYTLIDDVAVLAWLGQVGALEIHVPQWRVGPHGAILNPDRFVLDLDPGPGAGLPECVEVAKRAKRLMADLGLEAFPVTSGSKGLHLYAGLDGSHDAEYVNRFAKEFASALASELPDLVVVTQKKSQREGKVLADWSQNNQGKTTIAPYSLRGRVEPTVAVPRTWRELNDPDLRHLTFDEVLTRMKRRDDPMKPLARDADAGKARTDDKLTVYRSKRDAAKTPEPVPEGAADLPGDGNSFVIQEHHASRLHWDFRLERDGVLVSWALPKGVPTDPKKNHLAVQTEDHPLEYGTFEGTIPKGEYGGGEVTIWDAGTYEAEKWREGEVIATLTGREGGGLGGPRRFALIKTGENWLIHLMQLDGSTTRPSPRSSSRPASGAPSTSRPTRTAKPEAPMLATAGKAFDIDDEDDWAFEMKWDGYRAIAVCDGAAVSLFSRTGKDMTDTYPGVVEALAARDLPDTVLDGELVAFGANGAPSFSRLQQGQGPIHLLLFDVLRTDGDPLKNATYEERRAVLESLDLDDGALLRVPLAFEGSLEDAVASSQQLQLEGVVAKRRDSRYRSGTRSSSWLKIKNQRMQEAVIVGWRAGQGNRSGGVGSLLLAVPDGSNGLRYIGRVGTGFSDRALGDLTERLTRIERKTPPLDVAREVSRDARWVSPKLVGEVTYSEWTPDGHLRHPVWRGLRPDKRPDDLAVK